MAQLHTLPQNPTFSERLRQNRDQILDLWEIRVRAEVVAAKNLKPSDLKDSIPEVIANLANALEKGDGSEQPEISVARKHGRERSNFAQYSIEQIIFEYRLLRRTIFDVLGTKIPIDPNERDTIIDAIEVGISEATAEFASQQYQLREQFISALAHDLRNPLTAAKTSAQLILRFPERVDMIQMLSARIVDTIGRTDRMIQDLLDSNQVRAGGKLPLKIQSGDLRVIAKTTLEETASVQGDHFLLEATDSVIMGYWDISYLKRAIENLATNAIKYGRPDTDVIVTLSETPTTVTVEVFNEGEPLSGSEKIAIFHPFHRSLSARSGMKQGWGIGLSLVRAVAEAHGGVISVESPVNNGTTFTLTILKDSRFPEKEVEAQRVKSIKATE